MDHKHAPAIAFLLVLAVPLCAASCSPFLAVSNGLVGAVNQGQSATFAIVVHNNGPNPQLVSANSLCDTSKLDCSFDANFPVQIASGGSQYFHFIMDAKNYSGNYSATVQVFGGTGGNTCEEDRTFVLNVAPAATAQANSSAPLWATIAPSGNVGVQPGDTAEYTIIVQNNLAEMQFVQLDYGATEGNYFAQTSYSDADQFRLDAGSARTVTLKVTIPPGTPGGSYPFSIRVRGTTAGAVVNEVDLAENLFVFSPTLSMQWASAPSSCLQAFTGQMGEQFFTARNLGQITGPFQVELDAPAALAQFAQLTETSFQLNQQEATTFGVNFNASAGLAPGTYPYTVKVSYLGTTVLSTDSCVNLMGVEGIDAVAQAQYEITRGETQQIYLNVVNNGSLSSNYSFDYDPQPLRGTAMLFTPSSFTLNPSGSQVETITIQTNLTAPLGIHYLPVTLRSANQTQLITLALNFVSSNKSGESALEIASTQFKGFEGVPVQYPVAVRNNGYDDFGNVSLVVDGLPQGWVAVNTPPQQILSGGERVFLVTFAPPVGANRGTAEQLYAFKLHAVAGLESVSSPAFLDVSIPVPKMNFQVASVQQNSNVEGTQLTLKVAVYNQGNMPLTAIRPSLPYSSQYTVSADDSLNLAPGQQQFVNVQISPTVNTGQQEVLLRFESAQGAQTTEPLTVPALTAAGSASVPSDLALKALAILVVLAAILVALGKDEVEVWIATRGAPAAPQQPPKDKPPSGGSEKVRKLTKRVSGVERGLALHEGESRVRERVVDEKIENLKESRKGKK